MAKRLSILLMIALLVLPGCGSPARQTGDFSSSESEETSFLGVVSTDKRESQQESIPDSVIKVLDDKEAAENNGSSVKVNDTVNDEVNGSVTAEDEQMLYQAEVPEQKEADSNSAQAVSESTAPPQTESGNSSFREVESSDPEQPEPEELAEKPEERSSEENEAPPAETEPPQEESTEIEPEEETDPVPDFDIDYWVSYAQGLAQSKGLKLDATATECWDNPITANASCIYLERDLNARLDRYAGDEDITDVWIWYEDQGNGRFLIYIGYA